MSHGSPADADMISDEEFTEPLAETEETTPEEIGRSAAELDIAPPEEATVVDIDPEQRFEHGLFELRTGSCRLVYLSTSRTAQATIFNK